MSEDGPKDLSALDALFSRHGVGLSSVGQNLSAARKQQIYAGKGPQDQEPVNPTQETLKALIDYEETIPDQEVDDFVFKIRNAHVLDDYGDDSLDLHSAGSPLAASPSYNPWPLDEEDTPNSPTIIMADPLSGDILVTNLPNKQEIKTQATDKTTNKNFEIEDEGKEEEGAANGTLASSVDAESEDAVASSDDDDDDSEEAEDLTAEFEMEKGGEGGGGGGNIAADDRHGDGEQSNSNDDGLKEESNDWELIPRVGDDDVDDDVDDGKSKDSINESPKNENNGDEEEEDDEEEEEDDNDENEDSTDQIDASGEASKGSPEVPVIVNVDTDSKVEPKDNDKLSDTTQLDGNSSHGDKEHAIPASPEKKTEDPGFEAFLATLGCTTLDVDAQKSRARLSKVGPTRRPITKRFSDGKDDEQSKWMFTDSTVPKPKRPSIDEEEEEEEEEERAASRAPPRQPAGMGKRPPGLGGLGPMLLPGLGGEAISLKKTPTRSPNKTFQSTLEETKSQKEPSKTAPSPHGSPRKVLPNVGKTPPKPASRPKPQPKPAPAQEPSQPAWMKELKQRSPKKAAEVKNVSEVKEEKKMEEKHLNSDILHPAPSEKKEPEPQKTPSWMTNGKARLPPIGTPESSNKEEAAPSIPQWKKDLRDKKKMAVPAPSSVQKSPSKALEKSPAKQPPPIKPSSKPALRPHPKPAPAPRPAIAKKPVAKLPEKTTTMAKKEEKDDVDGNSSTSESSKPAAFKLPEKKMKVEDPTDRVSATSNDSKPGKKSVDDVTDGDNEMSESKKIKLSLDQNGESPVAEEKMDVGALEATTKEENGDLREGKDVDSEVRQNEGKDVKENLDAATEREKKPAMEQLKKEKDKVEEKIDSKFEEEVEVKIEKKEDVCVEEKKEAIVSVAASKKEELKPSIKSDEPKVTIVRKGEDDSVNGVVKSKNEDSSTVEEISEKKEEVPALNNKLKPAENQKAADRPAKLGYKPVKIISKANNNAKKDADVGKTEEKKKITIFKKSDIAKPGAGTTDIKMSDVGKPGAGSTDVKNSDIGKQAEVKKPDTEKSGSRKSNSTNEDEKVVVGVGKSLTTSTVMTKNSMNKEGPVSMSSQKGKEEKENEMGMNPEVANMPKWKRDALERKQKRKMSGGYAPLHKPGSTTIDTNMNNVPQWKKDLMEKRKMMPRMPSMDAAMDREEKGSKENLKSEKVLKRHTVAADVSVNVPSGHKTSVPSWKQELEKKKIGRLAKHLENKDAGPEIKEQNAETVATASS